MHIVGAVFKNFRRADGLAVTSINDACTIGKHNAGVRGFRPGLMRVGVGGVAGGGGCPAVVLGVSVVNDEHCAGLAAAHGIAVGIEHGVGKGSIRINIGPGDDRHAKSHHHAAGGNGNADQAAAKTGDQAGHFRTVSHAHQPL